MKINEMLNRSDEFITKGLNAKATARLMKMLGANDVSAKFITELHLYSEHLPKAKEHPFTEEQRCLHFLWDSLDRLPIGLAANFAVLFRRMIANKLFKKCGKNFGCEENVRFNFGQNIEVGDDVFINRGTFIDSKGGIKIGNSSGLGEFVTIFTHSHSESDHAKRTYKPVIIGDYAKIYTYSMILPGVTIGDEAIVAAKSLVSHDVEPGVVVAGIPAKPMRKRETNGRSGRELNHIWLADSEFQK